MSYILDAIRKSDLQRQRGAAPTLLTTHVMAASPKQPPFVLYGVLAVMLVGTGIGIGWLQPWQTQQPVPAPAPAPAPITLETVRQPAPEIPVRKSEPTARRASAPAIVESRSTPHHAPTGVPEKAAAPVPEKPGIRPADGVQEQRVMSVAELPPAIQQGIPSMSISVHAYSPKPQDRVVMINNRMLREGQELAPGLRLEQITPDGMIFSFGGYRFRRGLHLSGGAAEMK